MLNVFRISSMQIGWRAAYFGTCLILLPGCEIRSAEVGSDTNEIDERQLQEDADALVDCSYDFLGQVKYVKLFVRREKAWRSAADQKNATGQFALGMYHAMANRNDSDRQEAKRLFNLSAAQGNLYAKVGQGILVAKENPKAAVKLYHEAADAGLAWAQHKLAVAYENGELVKRNEKLAVELTLKAANSGLAAAQVEYGERLLTGNGVNPDPDEALKWFLKAADQGYVVAMNNAGTGLLENKQYDDAVRWFKLAASKGYPRAQFNLGFCHEMGYGVKKSNPEAAKLYRQSADAGDPLAQLNLGLWLAKGVPGVPKDFPDGIKLLRMSAKQGNASAQRILTVNGLAW